MSNLSQYRVGGAIGGSNSQLQFNNANVLGGSANLTWNNSSSIFSVTGNVGIGSTSPLAKLHVTGTVGISGAITDAFPTSLSSGLAGQCYVTHGANNYGLVVARAANDTGAANFVFYHTKSTDPSVKSALASGDSIGSIGFHGPVDSSNVIQGAGIKGLLDAAPTAGTAGTGILPTAITFQTQNAAGGAAERLRIDSTGNVGIGTVSPTSALTVYGGNNQLDLNTATGSSAAIRLQTAGTNKWQLFNDGSNNFGIYNYAAASTSLIINSSGNVGIGTASPSYLLHVNTDSAGKPGVGGLWTVVSDERIKTDITPADLDRCYEIVKSVPLKHFGFAPGVYTDDQIQDKHNLGWIAQDVQKVFAKAVSVKPFTLNTEIPDGTEEYTEQDFTLEAVEKTETSIQVIDGKPVQVSKVVTSENKALLFDSVDVVDEAGVLVMDGDKPLTYQIPRMVTKTRAKVRHDVIEDCLDLNGGQMIAALYGAVQSLMQKVETLNSKIDLL